MQTEIKDLLTRVADSLADYESDAVRSRVELAEEIRRTLAEAAKPAGVYGPNDTLPATMTRDEENAARLQEIGKSAFEALAEMVAALECDYDRLEELREERADVFDEANPWINRNEMPESYTCGCGLYVHPDKWSVKAIHIADCLFAKLTQWDADNGEELKELESAAGECKDRDDAEQRIHEDPLSVEVRSDWFNPCERDADRAPAEFRILLGTGGPAVQIVGELDASGQPSSATLQTQDWFLPWTDYLDADEETLLAYCRCFYFGEG